MVIIYSGVELESSLLLDIQREILNGEVSHDPVIWCWNNEPLRGKLVRNATQLRQQRHQYSVTKDVNTTLTVALINSSLAFASS